jgi:predicted CXXCH cytochrome family protein
MRWALVALSLLAAPVSASAEYLGSESCKNCHETPWAAWQTSHHYQAMLPASRENVKGDFNNSSFDYAGKTHRFFIREEKFFVETDNANGVMQEFEINYTFGIYPLQQYLIGFPDGRYQALNIVWDSRPKEEGGQRWYHLYPDDPVLHDDIVHWTGSFQNWNSRCAACHSTQLEKNYSLATNSYKTTWSDINVACEACHGPGSKHVDWASGEKAVPGPAFPNSMVGKGTWAVDGEKPTLQRTDGGNAQSQIETCAGCHARRSEMDEQHAGKPFHDLYQLRSLETDVYYADGQIMDEVYVYGSFLQSKMYQAGVACTNCHEPHSGELLLKGNALCSQCHMATVFDQTEHHHHETGSTGATCVNCHMPETTYMGVDDRRDHSFRIPEPQLTLELGIPNACQRCHTDKDANWAVNTLHQWNPQASPDPSNARLLAATRHSQANALPQIISLASDPTKPAIVRSTAILESSRFPSQETLTLLQKSLEDSDALVRASAVRSMDWLPATQRYAMLQPFITDSAKSVRMEVARQLADISLNQISANGRGELGVMRNEYLDFLRLNADMPESLLNLGSFLIQSGQPEEAERVLRQALKLSPQFVPAMLNLADLYRANELDSEASKLLQSAIKAAPEQAPSYHAMGLLLVRQQKIAQAGDYLKKAADLDPDTPRYAYVYAVALYEQGQQHKSVAILEQALQRHPGNPELISALRAYYQQLGENEKLQKLDMGL